MIFGSRGRHRSEGMGGGPDEPNNDKPPVSVQLLAALALFIIGGASSVAIAYASIVQHDAASTALLGTLATAALAALVVIAGGKHGE